MVVELKWLLDSISVFNRLQNKLAVTADRDAVEILLYAPELTERELADTLEVALRLEPLSVKEPTSIRIGLEPSSTRWIRVQYLHQMAVPYSGSSVLWKARPMPHEHVYLAGKASQSKLLVESLLEEQNFEKFEAYAKSRLATALRALPLQDPEINAYNRALPIFCKSYVDARGAEIMAWRRRGYQLREREAKRRKFEASQPSIDPVLPAWKLRVAELLQARPKAA